MAHSAGRIELWICSLVLTLTPLGSAAPIWTYPSKGDAVIGLAALPDGRGHAALAVAFHSGRLVCLDLAAKQPDVRWTVDLGSSVLAVAAGADLDKDGRPEILATTRKGQVECLSAAKGAEVWKFDLDCIGSAVGLGPDIDGDGVPEVLAGGCDKLVHLLNGRTGTEIWKHRGTLNPFSFANPGDVNADGTPDVAVWCGSLEVLDGRTGQPVWEPRRDDWFADGLAAPASTPAKKTGASAQPTTLLCCVQGTLKAVSARDGAVLWSNDLDRLRTVVACDLNGDGQSEIVAGTGAGIVACLPARGPRERKATWTTNLGDAVRQVIAPGDLDGDGRCEVVACGENGVVVALAGLTGKPIWRWQSRDVIRHICAVGDVDGDKVPDIAAAGLDGSVVLLPGKSREIANIAAAPTPATTPPKPQPKTTHRPTGKVPILLYHDILPESEDYIFVTLAAFREQMDLLVRGGYTCVSLDDVSDWLAGRKQLPPRPICITFDGPYAGQYTYVYPLLRERRLSVALYILTDWVGMPGHPDWDELREMQASGIFNLQNHTVHHFDLPRLPSTEMEFQLQQCNRELVQHLGGHPGQHHAYPDGAWNPAVARQVRALGFKTATIVRSADVLPDTDPMALPRYCITQRVSLERFKQCIGYEEK